MCHESGANCEYQKRSFSRFASFLPLAESIRGRNITRLHGSCAASDRVGALLIARDKLFVAGAPDIISPDDPWAAEQGRGPGVLAVFSAADGKELNRIALAAPPIWNGFAAANGRLYVALKNGQLVCLAGE